MEQKLSRIPVMILTLALAVLGFVLRQNQIKHAFDAFGVIPGKGRLFSWITLVVIVLFALFAFFLRGRKKYNAVSSRQPALMGVSCAAALLMVLSSILLLVNKTGQADLLLALGGVLTAGCWAGIAAARFRGKRAQPALFLVPVVYFMAFLIFEFRIWTRDPVILDYVYDLGALICIMCASLHLSGFCFDKGGRRITTFFCMCGIFFAASASAGTAADMLFRYLAIVLWLLVNLWLLLRPGTSRNRTAADVE